MRLSVKLIEWIIKRLVYIKLEYAHCICININEQKYNVTVGKFFLF